MVMMIIVIMLKNNNRDVKSLLHLIYAECTLERAPFKIRKIRPELRRRGGGAAESSHLNCQNLSAELFRRFQITLPYAHCATKPPAAIVPLGVKPIACVSQPLCGENGFTLTPLQ